MDEVVFRVQHALKSADPPVDLPFCAFNGALEEGDWGAGEEDNTNV